VLKHHGPEAVAGAWEQIQERHGDRPKAREIRAVLIDLHLPVLGRAPDPQRRPRVDRLEELIAQASVRVGRLVELQDAPHDPGNRARYATLACRARLLAQLLDTLAIEPMDELCADHGAERDAAGICRACRRPDLGPNRG